MDSDHLRQQLAPYRVQQSCGSKSQVKSHTERTRSARKCTSIAQVHHQRPARQCPYLAVLGLSPCTSPYTYARSVVSKQPTSELRLTLNSICKLCRARSRRGCSAFDLALNKVIGYMRGLPRFSHHSDSIIKDRKHFGPPGTSSSATPLCALSIQKYYIRKASLWLLTWHAHCCTGRVHRTAKGSGSTLALTSVLTVAGCAAMWGLLVLSAHLLWSPPERDLPVLVSDLADNDTAGDLAEASVVKVGRWLQRCQH